MDIRQQIVDRVDHLPFSRQEQVLCFVEALASRDLAGEAGATLVQFAGLIDSDSARQMSEAIESECEQVDASRW